MSLDAIGRAALRAVKDGSLSAEQLVAIAIEAIGADGVLRIVAKGESNVYLLTHGWGRGDSITCVFPSVEDARRAFRREAVNELTESLGPSVTRAHECIEGCHTCIEAQDELDAALAQIAAVPDELLITTWDDSFARVLNSWWDVKESRLVVE